MEKEKKMLGYTNHFLGITVLTPLSPSRFKQSKISLLIPHIYVSGFFVNYFGFAHQPGVPFRGLSTVWWCSKTFFLQLNPSLIKLRKISLKYRRYSKKYL